MKATLIFACAGAAVVVAVLWLTGCGDEEKPAPPPIKQDRYIPPPPDAVRLPPIPMTDVTEAAGIRFEHVTGAFKTDAGDDSRYLPECMGSGVVLFDPDGDGDDDIFLVNATWFEGHTGPGARPTSRLYRNDGNLRFTDVTDEAGLAIECYGMGGCAADYDGDGDQDLLVTAWGGVRLYRNDGKARFRDVTREAALHMPGWTDAKGRKGPDWSTGAAWFDADGDGDLDLFVCNYVRWTPEADIFFAFDGKTKSFTVPDRYEGNSCRLFLNDGDGTFTDGTKSSGVLNEDGKSLGVSLWDFNGDGRLDMVVANDQHPTFLYLNRGGGRFEEAGLDYGIAYDENGKTRAGMGIDTAAYLNDGIAGVPIGNFSREAVALYRQESPELFRDVTQQAGVAAVTKIELTFGLIFADMDLDGFQDIVMANGHLEPRVQEVWSDIPYAQAPLILRNQGSKDRGRFAKWNAQAGADFNRPFVGRGLASGDLDGDGDLDLVFTSCGGSPRLFRNDLNPERRPLRIKLAGKKPNTDAIGATIRVRIGDQEQVRLVKTGSSYLSQSELVQTFGLGGAEKADEVTVTWPDGTKTTRKSVGPGPSGLVTISP